jgi:hypothetical protein
MHNIVLPAIKVTMWKAPPFMSTHCDKVTTIDKPKLVVGARISDRGLAALIPIQCKQAK